MKRHRQFPKPKGKGWIKIGSNHWRRLNKKKAEMGKFKNKKVIFLGVGFETTAPGIAAALSDAKDKAINNFFVLCGNRLIPPAMDVLCSDSEIKIEGFLCPGHVSAIIGMEPYQRVVKKFNKGCVVAGFEPVDMTLALYMLLKQIKEKKAKMTE